MKFIMNPACLINKIQRSRSKNSYEQLVHEDDFQILRTSKKKKHASTTFDVFVGKEEEKIYRVPHKYRTHPKLLELINKYRPFVLDPRSSDPVAVECSTETFEQVLRYMVKNP